MSEVKNILIKVSGQDKPGITARLTSIIAQYKCNIADIGQSVTHGLLSLSIYIENIDENKNPILKDLLFEAKKMGMNLDFTVIEESAKPQAYKEKFIVSCVQHSGISSQFIAEISNYCATHSLNILDIENRSDKNSVSSLDLKITSTKTINFDQIKSDILHISRDNKIDLAIVKDNVFRFNKRLIIFDMDSTLIQAEVIEELARLNDSHAKVSDVTERAMNGELDFTESLNERVACLKGISKSQMETLFDKIDLTSGVLEFIKIVKSLGFKVAIISGGFTFFTNHFKNKLGIDYAFGNELEFDRDDCLTGKVKGTIIDAKQKATLLELLAQQESISLEQVVAIGDGANDLMMLAKAGMGIAFHAKEIVRKQADHHMSFGDMASILTFLGIPEDYSKQLL
ncbi:MAG: phosphoserine phosphatase SerB [Halobacteriovoraceae bacterium]|nr:phosphoserine phosphatase SerB [Halobacteriovoraceae bacterium]MCB9095182.1 phosphoserine phosphatase SerB [Halobacteriovoraceae bacterium]